MMATETTVVEVGKKPKVKKEKVAENANVDGDFVIKPSSKTPALDTSEWPILLKNYDRLNVRTGHYTPLTEGYSPTKRPLGKKSHETLTLLRNMKVNNLSFSLKVYIGKIFFVQLTA